MADTRSPISPLYWLPGSHSGTASEAAVVAAAEAAAVVAAATTEERTEVAGLASAMAAGLLLGGLSGIENVWGVEECCVGRQDGDTGMTETAWEARARVGSGSQRRDPGDVL